MLPSPLSAPNPETMYAPKYSEDALAVTIDGILKQVSSIGLDGAVVLSAADAETPEPMSDKRRNCEEGIPSADVTTTPRSSIQSERSFLSRELITKPKSVELPLLKKTPVVHRIRKWKLKPHPAFKRNIAGAPAAVPCYVNSFTTTTPHAPCAHSAKTPKTGLLTSPPPIALRRKYAKLGLPLPDLREDEHQPQFEEGLIPLLKPRPTVLFLSPHKRQRCDDNKPSIQSV